MLCPVDLPCAGCDMAHGDASCMPAASPGAQQAMVRPSPWHEPRPACSSGAPSVILSAARRAGAFRMRAQRDDVAALCWRALQRLSVAYNNLGGLLKMTGQALATIACYEQVGRADAPRRPGFPDCCRRERRVVWVQA